MPHTNSQSNSSASTAKYPQLETDFQEPISEPRVNPIFWIMGVVFAVLLGIVFFVINALSVYP